MHEIVPIPVADLLLDPRNSRLTAEGSTQQQTALALLEHLGAGSMLRLAEDVVNHSLDPLSLTAVVATGDRRKRYTVIEGNRRLLVLRALETPSFVSPGLRPFESKKLNQLAAKYAADPVQDVMCVLFDSEAAAEHWVTLRHTGFNKGVGLVEWGAVEQDNYRLRHHGTRKPAGQVLEFVTKYGTLSAAAQSSRRRVLTNIERLLGSPYVRDKLGIDVVRGQVIALHPREEVAKSLTRIVEDLKSGKVKVADLYTKEARENYADALPRTAVPKRSTRLADPVLLDDLSAGTKTPRTVPKAKRKKKSNAKPRTTVVPRTAQLEVTHPRINAIYSELSSLNAETYANACSVLLRVFVELSVDHTIEAHQLLTESQMRNSPLAKRIKTVLDHLEANNQMPARLKKAMEKVADGQSVLAASVPTFHLYVHNQYVFPKPSELYAAWDEMSPFMEKLWP